MSVAPDAFAPSGLSAPTGVALSEAAILAHGGRPIWLTSRDGLRLRAACFPAPAEAAGDAAPVLFLNGRGDFIEKHLETLTELRSRGHDVWTLDWRGQGHSQRLLPDPARGHAVGFDAFLDDLEGFVEDCVLPETGGRRLLLFAHSMGGNIGLRFLHRHPARFARAILTAPMIGLRTRLPSPALLRALPWAACRVLGREDRFAHGQDALGPQARGFEGNRLTSSRARFQRTLDWLEYDPNLWLGGTTWGWARAALASAAVTARAGFAERVAVPTLVIAAGVELIVDNRAMARMAARLPQGRLLSIADARHELLLESDGPRRALWRAVDGFLARAEPVVASATRPSTMSLASS